MAKKQNSGWVLNTTPEQKSSKLDATTKAAIETKARKFVDEVLKPARVKPPVKDQKLNYIIDVIYKWHGSTLYFIHIYASPGPNEFVATFESRFARLQLVGEGKFNLSYMRHNDQWVCLYMGKTIEECQKAICEDPWFLI